MPVKRSRAVRQSANCITKTPLSGLWSGCAVSTLRLYAPRISASVGCPIKPKMVSASSCIMTAPCCVDKPRRDLRNDCVAVTAQAHRCQTSG